MRAGAARTRVRLAVLATCAFVLPLTHAQGKPGPDRVGDVVRRLGSGEWTSRTMAAAEAGQLGPGGAAAVPGLVAILQDAEAPGLARATAATSLGQIGLTARAAAPALIAVLSNRDAPEEREERDMWESARANAAYALSRVGAEDKATVVPALLAVVKDDRGKVRGLALGGLTAIGAGAEKATRDALPSIIAALDDWKDFPWVRQVAAELVASMGPAARDAVPALERARRDMDPDLREAARAALAAVQRD